MTGRCGACSAGALAAGDHRGRSRSAAGSSPWAPGLDLPDPGACPAWWPKPWAYEGEILWDTSKPDGNPEKTTRRPASWRPLGLEARKFPGRRPAPDRPVPMPQGLPRRAIRSPLNLASWPSIEGLISADQVATDGRRPRWDCFPVLRRSPSLQDPTFPLTGRRGCQQRFQASCLSSPRFQPTQQDSRQRRLEAPPICPVLLTCRRCGRGAAPWPCSMPRLACCEISHRFASDAQLQQGPAGSAVHQGGCLRPARPRRPRAPSAAWPPLPTPIGDHLISSVHRSPRAQPMVGDLPLLRQSPGTLAVRQLWGDDIDMVKRVRLSLLSPYAKNPMRPGPGMIDSAPDGFRSWLRRPDRSAECGQVDPCSTSWWARRWRSPPRCPRPPAPAAGDFFNTRRQLVLLGHPWLSNKPQPLLGEPVSKSARPVPSVESRLGGCFCLWDG